MEIEQDRDDIYRLCWLVEQQRQAELEYLRARWQLSYYKKSGALKKKIEEMRLHVLGAQKNRLDINFKLRPEIGALRNKLKAVLDQSDGVIIGIKYPLAPKDTSPDKYWLELGVEQIVAMADEYEVSKALNDVLMKQNNDND